MNEREIQQVVREKGMCGRLLGVDGYRSVCIKDLGHDGGIHDLGWTVQRRTIISSYKRDEREADSIVFDVREGAPVGFRRVFTTDNEDHAKWLASTLTRLDL